MTGSLTSGRRLMLAVAVVLALAALVLRAAPARAETQVIDVVIHVPDMVVTNTCADPDQVVVLHGDLHIHQVRTTTPDGGELVRSRITSEGLVGEDVNGTPYTAKDVETSFVHYAPPGQTSTFLDLHATLLVPHGNVPRMLLVMVVAETVQPDGTTTVLLDRTYTVCRPAAASRAV